MSGLSQPERRGLERMQMAEADWHPDADLLTAFAEHSVTVDERERLLGHLAQCASCREVLVLAGSPLVEPVPEPARKRGMWEMPLFHWGAVAATATVVIFAIAIGIRDYRPAAPKTAATATFNEMPPAPPATAKIVAVPAVPTVAKTGPAQAKGELAANSPTNIPGTTTTKRAVHLQEQVRYEKAIGGPENTPSRDDLSSRKKDRQSSITLSGAVPQPQTPPAANIVNSANGAFSTQNADKAYNNYEAKVAGGRVAGQAAAPPSAPRQVMPRSTTESVTVAAESVEVQTSEAGQAAKQTRPQAAQPAAPRASNEVLDVTGAAPAVQSSEAGVAAPAQKKELPFNGRNLQQLVTPAGTQYQVAKHGQLQRQTGTGGWENVLTGHRVQALAVSGNRVWAGSDDGRLYVSGDNGANWNPVSVHDGAIKASGNITQMKFTDAQNGTLSTSTAETWTTSDAGQTWHKQ